jgi:hypothetical protein
MDCIRWARMSGVRMVWVVGMRILCVRANILYYSLHRGLDLHLDPLFSSFLENTRHQPICSKIYFFAPFAPAPPFHPALLLLRPLGPFLAPFLAPANFSPVLPCFSLAR